MKLISNFLLLTFLSLSVFSQPPQNDKNNRFEIAMKDAKVIEFDELHELKIPAENDNFINVSMSDCKKDKKIEPGSWLTSASEFKDFYKNNAGEFSDKPTRIRELLGLLRDDDPKCVYEFQTSLSNLKRPTMFETRVTEKDLKLCPTAFFTSEAKKIFDDVWQKWQNDKYPLTKLGYTCDWHYDDGCHYGLSEFVLQTGVKENIKAKNVEEYFADLKK